MNEKSQEIKKRKLKFKTLDNLKIDDFQYFLLIGADKDNVIKAYTNIANPIYLQGLAEELKKAVEQST